MSWVKSVGSGRLLAGSAVGGRVGVGVGDALTQPVSRVVTIKKTRILLIVISIDKYT
jgi:hypothetical protein